MKTADDFSSAVFLFPPPYRGYLSYKLNFQQLLTLDDMKSNNIFRCYVDFQKKNIKHMTTRKVRKIQVTT